MSDIAILRSAAEADILARFPDFSASQTRWGGEAVAAARRAAFDVLKQNGLPTRRVEEWKYTDLRALMRAMPPLPERLPAADVEAAALRASALDLANATRILFVNGELVAAPKAEGFGFFSLANGDDVPASVAQALQAARPYAANAAVALNTAFMTDVIALHVPAGTALDTPIHLVFRHAGAEASSFPRVLLVVEEGASATLVESHDGPNGVAYLAGALVEIVAGDTAEVSHIRHNDAGDGALVLSTLGMRMGAQAKVTSFSFTTGGAVSRNQLFVALEGEDSTLSVNGASLLRGNQHADSTMFVDHAVPGCTSRELFKHVLDDESRGVFQGKIVVRQPAQKTDGRMMSRALLLGEGAEMDNKPELEIFADDVQCGHGATCGDIDEELLFYLRARGIPLKEAQSLLVQAFVGEAIETVEHDGLREAMIERTEAWLKARG